jgi:hypothetical protein
MSYELHAAAALPQRKYRLISRDKRLVGPQSRSEQDDVKKNLVPLSGIQSRFTGFPACGYIHRTDCRSVGLEPVQQEIGLYRLCSEHLVPSLEHATLASEWGLNILSRSKCDYRRGLDS